jgi:hypothetical protein
MNNIVKNMNEEWFKAHQWFLISTSNKNKAKSAVRVHETQMHPDCIAHNHPLLKEIYDQETNGWRYDLYNRKQELKRKLIANGEVTVNDCVNRYHWKTIVPKSRNDIPHEGYNKKNSYIYYYLIECYRYYNKHHESELKRVNNEIDELHPKVERYYNLLKRKEELNDKYKDNEIFKKSRVNDYKSV